MPTLLSHPIFLSGTPRYPTDHHTHKIVITSEISIKFHERYKKPTTLQQDNTLTWYRLPSCEPTSSMTDMFLIRSHLPQQPISRLILNLLGQKPILPKVSSRCDETLENAKLCSLSGPCKLHLSKRCPHSNKCDACFQYDIGTLCAPSPGCHKRQLICSFYPPL